MPGAREYVVHHGADGHLGRFRAGDDAEFSRGATVVVRGRRGLELGHVLIPIATDRPSLPDEFVGELVRIASNGDLSQHEQNRRLGQKIFETAVHRAEARAAPVSFVDVEVALDAGSAVLHGLRLGDGDLGPLLEELGDEHSLIVRLHEVNGQVAEDEHGCGSCGSGGCGSCGSGGCSSCSSGAAKELADYFAGLRAQMESHHRVALL
jgi:hypothetical protein